MARSGCWWWRQLYGSGASARAAFLTDDCAWLGADVVCYSFIAMDFHHLLLAGLAAHPELMSMAGEHSTRFSGLSQLAEHPVLRARQLLTASVILMIPAAEWCLISLQPAGSSFLRGGHAEFPEEVCRWAILTSQFPARPRSQANSSSNAEPGENRNFHQVKHQRQCDCCGKCNPNDRRRKRCHGDAGKCQNRSNQNVCNR